MKVWIDLSNSPHPLLFEPIARRLEELGHAVCVTARDNAQTVELAHERWPEAEVIGGPSPGGRAAKGGAMLGRVISLRGGRDGTRPDVALSHGSYAQIVAARSIGVPAVTAMDYEHQPANHLAFRLASRVLLPEALRGTRVVRQGAAGAKTRFYDGLKEELYLANSSLIPECSRAIGLQRNAEARLVVARTPPSGALYHRSENRLFLDALFRTWPGTGRAASSSPAGPSSVADRGTSASQHRLSRACGRFPVADLRRRSRDRGGGNDDTRGRLARRAHGQRVRRQKGSSRSMA